MAEKEAHGAEAPEQKSFDLSPRLPLPIQTRTVRTVRGYNEAYNEGFNAGFAKGFEDGHQLAYKAQ